MSLERFAQELYDLGVARELSVTPKSPVKGKTLPEVKTCLSVVDAKGAFATSQKVEKKGDSNATISFDEFLVCLALCGSIKYSAVEQVGVCCC